MLEAGHSAEEEDEVDPIIILFFAAFGLLFDVISLTAYFCSRKKKRVLVLQNSATSFLSNGQHQNSSGSGSGFRAAAYSGGSFEIQAPSPAPVEEDDNAQVNMLSAIMHVLRCVPSTLSLLQPLPFSTLTVLCDFLSDLLRSTTTLITAILILSNSVRLLFVHSARRRAPLIHPFLRWFGCLC